MSAFIAGTPVTAKVVAKPIARRDVTVRAAANSEYVRAGVATARDDPRRLFRFFVTDHGDRCLRAPSLPDDTPHMVSGGLNRRAADAGERALFAAARRCVSSTPLPRRRRDRDPPAASARFAALFRPCRFDASRSRSARHPHSSRALTSPSPPAFRIPASRVRRRGGQRRRPSASAPRRPWLPADCVHQGHGQRSRARSSRTRRPRSSPPTASSLPGQ